MTEKLRTEINKVVNKYIDQGVAELVPGVLFIDEVHMLDIECFTFLNKALESQLAPVVVFATNRGTCRIRGTDMRSPHGIPADLLDRLLVIRTKPYGFDDLCAIVGIRAAVEEVPLEEGVIAALGEIGGRSSLRYVMQLLTPALVLAGTDGRAAISVEDVRNADGLFHDAKRSGEHLKKNEELYMYQ